MKFTKIRTRGVRIIAVATFIFGLALSASIAVPATAAQAASACAAIPDGGNTYSVPYGCNNVVIAHACYNLVTDEIDNVSADECADIWAQNTSGRQYIWGVGEFYCQGAYPQCQGMNVTVDASFAEEQGFGLPDGPAETVAPAHYKCNPNPGPACPATGREYLTTSIYDATGADFCTDTYSWDPYDGWKGNSEVIAIKPTDLAEHSSYELDSQHVAVCFEPS